MTWLDITTIAYVSALVSPFAYIAVEAIGGLIENYRETYRKLGYEQGARDQLEDELERKDKMIAGRMRLGR